MKGYPEYSIVKTRIPLVVTEDVDTYRLPVGAEGTIVDISVPGEWYLIEFECTPIKYGAGGEVLEWPEYGLAGMRHEDLELLELPPD
jgi:hypothetical protein